MGVCEVCQGPITARCAGLDVPELEFCAKHAREHQDECPEIKAGKAQMWWIPTWPRPLYRVKIAALHKRIKDV